MYAYINKNTYTLCNPQKSEHTLTHRATHTYAKEETKKRKGKEVKRKEEKNFRRILEMTKSATPS